MNFFQAVKICFGKYSVFKGRASRSEYFYFLLFVILVQLVLITIDYENYGRNTNFIEYIELVNAFQRMAPFYWVFNVIVLIPTLAVAIPTESTFSNQSELLLMISIALERGLSAFEATELSRNCSRKTWEQ